MKSYFVMNRTGKFTPEKTTSNQCKAPGHGQYFYHLKMVFLGGMKLDENSFILDHQDVDDLVTGLILQGSCEEMNRKIMERLAKLMGLKSIPMVACKCTIRPGLGDGPAWLEYTQVRADKYLHCLQLL